uniref:t-SNARE coiled-coil homology domain-containing protein n=1 Tax=Grammatophora oceanica TaxID=210454 RepID=A0A7S1Y3U3_9STRA
MAEDRTSEFMALARSLPPSGAPSSIVLDAAATASTSMGGRYGGAGSVAPPAPMAGLRDFHQTAGGISKDIAATSHMLAQLTDLVRSSSNQVFMVEDTQQVNHMVRTIKASMESLNGRLDQAQTQLSRAGRKKSQAQQEASNLVQQLQEQFGMTASQFKNVLQQRTDHMKTKEDVQKQVVYGAATPAVVSLDNRPVVYDDNPMPDMSSMTPNMAPTLNLTSAMSAGEPSSSASHLPRPHGAVGALYSNDPGSGMRLRHAGSDFGAAPASYLGAGSGAPLTPFDMQRMEQESNGQQSMQLIPDQSYLRERADAMQQVETSIVELGTIFNKLAVMVNEHQELVQRVEDNVDEANTNMTLSMETLTDTLTNLKTNRALFTKVFGVLVAFIMIFIIFFA